MRIFKFYKRKVHGILVTWILLISIFTISLFSLVQPTGSLPPWWNLDWNFRKRITLSRTMAASTLEDFPILIDIIDDDLRDKARYDGYDIVFTDADGNKLSHEIEIYDCGSGHLVAWVKIPLLSNASDTELYMYYGNPDSENQQNPKAVWDSNFVMVQHLNEDSGTRYDSTTNQINGIVYGNICKGEGKIGKADAFNGVNSYLKIQEGFLPTSAITVELWLKPTNYSTTVWRKYINTGPTTTSGICGGQTSLSQDRWSLALSWDNKTKTFSSGGRSSNYEWIHLAITWNGTYAVAYYNGEKVRESAVTGTPDWAGRPLYLGSNYRGGECFEGLIDELRISNISRSQGWILTSYRNQKDPASLCAVGDEELSILATPILILNKSPPNEARDVYTNPTLSVYVFHIDKQKNMTIIFKEKTSKGWIELARFNNVSGIYSLIPTTMKNLGTTYYWNVEATDGSYSVNKTFSFTTATKILQQKWVATNIPKGVSGVLIADVTGDGLEEIFHAGKGGVVCLNGTDGSIIWRVADDGVGFFAQPQMADLNKDGILEIIVPLESPAGLLVLHANNGSTYWRITGLGKETYSSPVTCDIDGDGYLEIFVASTDISKGLGGDGRITSLNYNGTILHQTFAWRPCGGGLSIADADGDGEFELYMGDRYMYMNKVDLGDNGYGKGVQSFWARNLTLRWSRPDIHCSSQIPMLADVNGDGVLDVVIGDLRGGVAVLNSTDGSTIKIFQGGLGVTPTHYQPSVYDVDGDGNLEFLMADPHDDPLDPVSEWPSDDIVIWDLVNWKVDARIYIGKCFYGPQLADVTGDGIMEIIACNYKGIFIIDKTYRVIDGIVGLNGVLNYAVAQDIDGDGYTEIVVSSQGGCIYAFDTPARRPNPRPRTEVQFYSEYRLGAAEYVQPQGGPAPIIYSPNPPNNAKQILPSISKLEFSVTDYQNDPMNITVTTNPDIGSVTLKNVGNGRYVVNISDLRYSTTYTWTITATDGTHSTYITYTFKTQEFSPWWNTAWQYRKAIIIDKNKVATNLENFPILIDIIDDDLSKKAQDDGDDIVFTDSNGIKLAHEIELYDNHIGRLIAWVNVPLLSSDADTKLYIYYGNQNASNQQDPSKVWDSEFVMVQHLEENAQTRYDSTSKSNNGIVYGIVNKDNNGKIGFADAFYGSGYIKIPDNFLPTSAITVELWLKPFSYSTTTWTKYINTGPTTTTGICGGQTSLSQDRWSLTLTWNNKTESFSTGGQPSSYDWIHLAVTWNGTHAQAYYNGIKIRETAVSGAPDWAGKPFYLGSNYFGSELFNGSIDEVRISNIARSHAWIQTSFNNQKDPTEFYMIGDEEMIPVFPVVYAPTPANNAMNVSPSLTELSFNITELQNDLMNYTVMTYPYIGSASGTNVRSGKISVPVSNLQYFTTYTWTISVTDGDHWTNTTFTFTTLLSEPPTHNDPILIKVGGNIVCYNQLTIDSDGDTVTNIYNWYKNGISITNLLLPFDTNTISIVKDYSGYNNHGTIIRDVKWTPNGIVGGAYNFNRGYIQIPGTNTLDGGGTWTEITVEAWIKLSAYPPSGTSTRIIARIPSYEIGITSGKQLFASIWTATGKPPVSGHNMITTTTTLNLNTWYHIVLTYKKGIGMTLYVNGAVVATKTATESATLNYNIQPSGPNPLYIGWFDYFKGTIDEIRIYPRSLTPQQIQQRYNETKDGKTNSSTIVAEELKTGEKWYCKVTPNDSHQDGTTKTSNTVTIGQNDNPIAKNLKITPTTPKTTDDLTATYTYFDPDGDPESGTEIYWYRNGQLVPELNNSLIVPSSYTTKGETWYFTVKPSDGTEHGETRTSPIVTILNSPPKIISWYPQTDPNPILLGQSQEFNIIYNDPDNDPVTIQWYINGTLKGEWTGLTSINFEPEQVGTYIIEVIVSDQQSLDTHSWTLIVQESQ